MRKYLDVLDDMGTKSFPTQKECEANRANPWQRCVASDDPRLKEK